MVVCSRCGTQSPDGTNFCPKCGQNLAAPAGPPPFQQYGQYAPSQQVPNYLVWAILATLFCCLPFGIVSIIYAAQVDGKRAAGDYEGAVRSSGQAKTWAIASALCGVGIILLYVLLFAFVGLTRR